MTYSINERYIIATIKGADRNTLVNMRDEAAKELVEIKNAKADLFKRYPGVHGRFQQSQLDVLDIRETKMCAMFDNLSDMICLAAA
jgi:hypothetical protein